MVGTVVKAKVGEMEEEIKEGFSRRLRKEMTGVVQEVVGNRRHSVRFQDGLEKEMSQNQPTIVVVRIEVEEEIDVRVYIDQNFIKEDGVNKREDQVGVETYTDEEEI